MTTNIDRKRLMKACTPCAKLKIRCEFDPLGRKCKRCIRLGKECHDQTPGAHKKKRVRANHELEIQRLESMVHSMSQLVATGIPGTATPPFSLQPTSTPELLALLDPGADFCDPPFDTSESASCIKLFVDEMASMFPFVVFSPDMTPGQLQREKPLVFKCLTMITCQNNLDRQSDIAQAIGNDISQLLSRRERSLATLQGILLYVAWSHVHQHLGHGFLSPIHIAMAMVTEMRLDEEAQPKSKIGAGALRGIGADETPPARTLDERRAYLGVFWMASIINSCFHSMVTPRFTKYTEECCRILETAQDHSNDAYLVQLIRLLRMVDKVDRRVYRDSLDESGEMTSALVIVVGMLQQEVTLPLQFEPTNPTQAVLLRLAHKMLQLHLYKLASEDNYFPPEFSDPTFRADLLVACLSTIEKLLDTFCGLPDLAVLSLPYGYWGMVGHAMKIYSRLSGVRYGMWTASATLNPCHVFGRVAQKMEDANTAGQNAHPSRRMPEFYEEMVAKLRDLDKVKQNVTRPETFPTNDVLLDNDMMGDMLFDFDLLEWT